MKHEDDVNVKKKLFAIDPDFHELAISYTDKGVVSNGFYGLLLATELCGEVKVYGFSVDGKAACTITITTARHQTKGNRSGTIKKTTGWRPG